MKLKRAETHNKNQRRIKGFCVCLANEDESNKMFSCLIRAVLCACLDRFVLSGCISKMDVRLVCLERKRESVYLEL